MARGTNRRASRQVAVAMTALPASRKPRADSTVPRKNVSPTTIAPVSSTAWSRTGIDASSPTTISAVPATAEARPTAAARPGPATPLRRSPSTPTTSRHWARATTIMTTTKVPLDHGYRQMSFETEVPAATICATTPPAVRTVAPTAQAVPAAYVAGRPSTLRVPVPVVLVVLDMVRPSGPGSGRAPGASVVRPAAPDARDRRWGAASVRTPDLGSGTTPPGNSVPAPLSQVGAGETLHA